MSGTRKIRRMVHSSLGGGRCANGGGLLASLQPSALAQKTAGICWKFASDS
jgi:hypothetical protein